jgi:hypothetical protein
MCVSVREWTRVICVLQSSLETLSDKRGIETIYLFKSILIIYEISKNEFTNLFFYERQSCHRWKFSEIRWRSVGAVFLFPTPLLAVVDLRISWTTRTKTLFTKEKKFPGTKPPASRWRRWTEGRPSMGFLLNSSERWWSCGAARP